MLFQGQPGSSNTPYQAAISLGASQVQHYPSLAHPSLLQGFSNQAVPEAPGELQTVLTPQNWVEPRVPISRTLPRSADATGKTLRIKDRYVRRCSY